MGESLKILILHNYKIHRRKGMYDSKQQINHTGK